MKRFIRLSKIVGAVGEGDTVYDRLPKDAQGRPVLNPNDAHFYRRLYLVRLDHFTDGDLVYANSESDAIDEAADFYQQAGPKFQGVFLTPDQADKMQEGEVDFVGNNGLPIKSDEIMVEEIPFIIIERDDTDEVDTLNDLYEKSLGEPNYGDPLDPSIGRLNRLYRMSRINRLAGLDTASGDIWYHGTTHNFITFTDEFVGEGHDQEGPGIYFTSSEDDARNYGGKVFKVKLNFRKAIPNKGRVRPQEVLKLMRMSSGYGDKLDDWDENPLKAEKAALDLVIRGNDTPPEVFQQVWIDFYRYDPVAFVRNMVSLGYDGFIRDRNQGVRHAIIFNPSIIEYLGEE